MPGLVEATTPSYISSQSADVILSDVRPFKLKADALHAINVLLDEFLYNILNTAGSLSTDKLRAGLLSLLPTSLGKEALLEAEVELRAYWERSAPEGKPLPLLEDDSKAFHLQWTYELLRLKCEAYSTLNESDENMEVEEHINGRFRSGVAVAPSITHLEPAALYLTAILEAMCEHILTNVGRVAARDSSQDSAGVGDLFTALCEDDSIYGLFRSLRVYEQIELLSKGPAKSRRSRSFTRTDLSLSSRAASPHQDLLSGKDHISIPRSRLSSDANSTAMPGLVNSTARTSLEKARSLKLFSSNKASIDTESQTGHSSVISSEKQPEERSLYEDVALQQEFDDLMRSSATMKVSLTPDRLRTMEVYKQEKDMRANRRPAPLSFNTDISISTRPTLRHVDSIIEDDEELAFPQPPVVTPRTRQTSLVPTSPPLAGPTRTRTSSAISAAHLRLTRNNSRQKAPALPENNMSYPHKFSDSNNSNGFPPRTRKRQVNRESLDLDDVMGNSDDDISSQFSPSSRSPPVSAKSGPKVSSATRDLMDFLAQGPPGVPSKLGGDIGEFLNNGPHQNYSSVSVDAKPKGDRLRRMISKLSISGDRSKNGSVSTPSKTPVARQPPPLPAAVLPTPPRPHQFSNQPPLANLPSLANRPIPPRPPRAPSPSEFDKISPPPPSPPLPPAPLPKSPDHSSTFSSAQSSTLSSNRSHSPTFIPPRKESRDKSRQISVNNGTAHSSTNSTINGNEVQAAPRPSVVESHQQVTTEPEVKSSSSSLRICKPTTTHTAKPPPYNPAVGLPATEVQELHRLISQATTADECRLILSMFLTKSKDAPTTEENLVTYPPPSGSVTASNKPSTHDDAALENSVLELFLGGDGSLEGLPLVVSNVSPAVINNVSGVNMNPPTPTTTISNSLVGEMKLV